MILLDSDIMIDLLREHPPALRWLETLEEEEIGLPGFVVMELIQGCRNKPEQQKVENLLAGLATVWPDAETCEEALRIFSRFHLSHNLGLLDALIGQLAVALKLPLYTFNRKHYAAIPHLMTVEPFARG